MTLPNVTDSLGNQWGVGSRSDGKIISDGGLFTVDPVSGVATEVPAGNGTAAAAIRVALANDSTGTVTANAGANLNTSLLALESGHLASIDTHTTGLALEAGHLASIDTHTTGLALEAGHLATIDTNIAALLAAGEVGIPFLAAASIMTRPANTTTYVIGQLIANSVTAGSVVPLVFTVARAAAGTCWIYDAYILKSTAANQTTFDFNLLLFTGTVAPTVTGGDGATLALSDAALANYIGSIECIGKQTGATTAIADGVPNNGSGFLPVKCGAGVTTIWGLLVAKAAYPPGNAEQFTVSLAGEYRS